MKYLTLSLGIVLVLILTNCESDNNNNDNSSLSNYIKYNNKKYEITQGYVMYYGTRDDVHRYNPMFYSSDITVHGVIDSLSGTGHAIGFDLHTSQKKLETGNYNCQTDIYEHPEPYIFSGNYIINENVQNADDNKSFKSGTLTIEKNNSSYIFEFNGTNSNGEYISFYYEGNVTIYEDEGVK